ncbi:MAG: hypothetical protein CVV11_12980 [Gammaproteobacteria bacterium HGW-Gammaproteobacteria-15]|nr:MAG: hypothetical protein CVV11_12980 [Gammaproteobacteria bacterium HGW-Gammaproteobacteria-15]
MEIIKRYQIKLDKKDYLRALLTDTAPSDVPLIFSNEGLYINSHRAKRNSDKLIDRYVFEIFKNHIDPSLDDTKKTDESMKKKKMASSPFKYKIIKNESSLRTLSLLHPRAQINISELYKQFSSEINYLCSKSKFSIRAPVKVANSFTLKTSKRSIDIKDYKSIDVDTLDSELYKRSASSFFTYKGKTRLYKIYNSERFIELEKKFSHMWLLDISNCFDSIYSHSISWAAKDKEFIKSHVKSSNQFCQTIDTLMQRTNNNETNGICIGSEFSRIFAEIIFQKIDVDIERLLLEKLNLKHAVDYEIIRYVDDYMIFSKSIEDQQAVYNAVSDSINKYNLYLSSQKLQKYSRPLLTEKSSVVVVLAEILKNFDDNVFESRYENKNKILIPRKIFRKDRLKNSMIDKVKKVCKDESQDYSLASSYLISVFNKRVSSLIYSYERFLNSLKFKEKNGDKTAIKDGKLLLRDLFETLLSLMLFFYSVKPSLSSSNKIAQSIIEIDRFLEISMPEHSPFIRTMLMNDVVRNLAMDNKDSYREGFVTLEKLNILLATNEFSNNYSISSSLLNKLVDKSHSMSYFDIVSILYYCKNNEIYSDIIIKIEEECINKLALSDLSRESEILHLALDLSTCPYISRRLKEIVFRKLYGNSFVDDNNSKPEDERLDAVLSKTYWFVKWSGADLYSLLLRKELNPVY